MGGGTTFLWTSRGRSEGDGSRESQDLDGPCGCGNF